MITDPNNITVGDLIGEALIESGAIGVGQTADASDLVGAWARLQMMLQEWENKRWLVYFLETKIQVSTGAQSYSVGPGGVFDTGAGSSRPDRLEAAFLRQFIQGGNADFNFPDFDPPDFDTGGGSAGPVDFPLEILQSMEDYSRITLKQLGTFSRCIFYNPTWPQAAVYPWPIPQASQYAIGIVVRGQLPQVFATQATKFGVPWVYYNALLYNLALRLRSKYGVSTFPGDPLPNLAKDSLATIRGSNTAIARLTIPQELIRPGIYSIYSDRSY